MIEGRLSQAARMVGARAPKPDAEYRGVATDTRTLQAGELFVALVGPNHDGHEHLESALERGAAGAVVGRRLRSALPLIRVRDTRLALGRLGSAWRERHDIPLIAVTGSNGKTTVKEMLAAICATQGPVLATRGNLNNDIGVPLTLLHLGAEHRCAVVELGANHAGEIAYLTGLAKPTVGLVNNAAAAHLEGFGSLEGVVRAKGELYGAMPATAVAVINGDDAGARLWRELAGARPQVLFGSGPDCEVRLADLSLDSGPDGISCRCLIQTPHGSLEVDLALAGRHNALNATAATAAALAAGLGLPQIRGGLEAVRPVPGRLQFRPGRAGARILDDSYNANPNSLGAALEVLAQCGGERWLVLGAMAELGPEARALHRRMGQHARELGIDRLLALGPLGAAAAEAFGGGGSVYEDHEGLAEAALAKLHGELTVLIKGSRSARMERVSAALVDAEAEARLSGPAAGAAARTTH